MLCSEYSSLDMTQNGFKVLLQVVKLHTSSWLTDLQLDCSSWEGNACTLRGNQEALFPLQDLTCR